MLFLCAYAAITGLTVSIIFAVYTTKSIFAKKAGFNSHTLLGMVIRGQRNLSATSIRAFCRALEVVIHQPVAARRQRSRHLL